MFNYRFKVEFVAGITATDSIKPAILRVQEKFNNLHRKNYKHLNVSIDTDGSLIYELQSDIKIDIKNRLRCTQYFSKELSKEDIMNDFVCPNRLMKRKY